MIRIFRRIMRKLVGLETEPHNIALKEELNHHDSVTYLPDPTHPEPPADPNVIRPLHKMNGRHP